MESPKRVSRVAQRRGEVWLLVMEGWQGAQGGAAGSVCVRFADCTWRWCLHSNMQVCVLRCIYGELCVCVYVCVCVLNNMYIHKSKQINI